MVFTHEEYQEHLDKLNNPEISAEDRTEVLTALRNNYTTTLDELSTKTTSEEKLKASNDDLLKANARLFNETGYQFTKDPMSNDPKDDEEEITYPSLREIEEQYQ